MKSFELGEYMKPMISKAGIIASRKNQYFLKAVKKMINPKTFTDPLPDFKPRLPKMKKKKSKSCKSSTGSYSFKAISRKEQDNSESPPPNRYKPSYSLIHKKPPTAVFGKEKIRDLFGKIEDYSSFQQGESIDSPRRLPGIAFDKQLDRKGIVEETVGESRYESALNSSLLNTNKVHSFEAYTPRKTFFKIHEFQPEYEPKHGFLFKSFKNRKE
jgi:hypothetical protein